MRRLSRILITLESCLCMGCASGPACVYFIGKDGNKGKVHLESARFKPYTLSFIEHCKIKVFKLSITPANGNGSEPKKSMQRDLTAKVLLLLSKYSYWQLWDNTGITLQKCSPCSPNWLIVNRLYFHTYNIFITFTKPFSYQLPVIAQQIEPPLVVFDVI